MATRARRVVWTEQARRMLDDAVACVVNDSRPAAERLLIEALAAAASLDTFSERGRLPFIHGARDLARSRLEI